MSEADEEDEEDEAHPIEGSPERPSMTGQRILEMDAIGWGIFIALLIVLLPLLPIIVLLLVLGRLLGLGEGRTVSWS